MVWKLGQQYKTSSSIVIDDCDDKVFKETDAYSSSS